MSDPEATAPSSTDRVRRSNMLIIGGVSLALLVIGAVALLCLPIFACAVVLGLRPGYPSDEEMIARYVENKAEFERLAQMMMEEKEIDWVSDDECQLRDRTYVSGQQSLRCQEFLDLCHHLGIKDAAIGHEHLTLYVGSWGGAMGGSAISYEYTTTPPSSGLVADTRNPGEEWRDRSRYRHIEGNWYIFLFDN